MSEEKESNKLPVFKKVTSSGSSQVHWSQKSSLTPDDIERRVDRMLARDDYSQVHKINEDMESLPWAGDLNEIKESLKKEYGIPDKFKSGKPRAFEPGRENRVQSMPGKPGMPLKPGMQKPKVPGMMKPGSNKSPGKGMSGAFKIKSKTKEEKAGTRTPSIPLSGRKSSGVFKGVGKGASEMKKKLANSVQSIPGMKSTADGASSLSSSIAKRRREMVAEERNLENELSSIALSSDMPISERKRQIARVKKKIKKLKREQARDRKRKEKEIKLEGKVQKTRTQMKRNVQKMDSVMQKVELKAQKVESKATGKPLPSNTSEGSSSGSLDMFSKKPASSPDSSKKPGSPDGIFQAASKPKGLKPVGGSGPSSIFSVSAKADKGGEKKERPKGKSGGPVIRGMPNPGGMNKPSKSSSSSKSMFAGVQDALKNKSKAISSKGEGGISGIMGSLKKQSGELSAKAKKVSKPKTIKPKADLIAITDEDEIIYE